MNRTYKVIWSKARHCYVVVSELTKSQHKSSSKSELISTNVHLGGVLGKAAVAAIVAGLLTFGGVAYSPVLAAGDTTVNENTVTNTDKTITDINANITGKGNKVIDSSNAEIVGDSNTVTNEAKGTIIRSDMSEVMMRVFMARVTLFLPAVISRSLVIITRLLAEMT